MSTANRIDTRLARCKADGRAALVPFFTAGDPSLEATVPVMHALVAAGADVLELGVPFSDPMADGPVIQQSSERALARGAGLAHVLDSVRRFRERDPHTPVVLMGYLNPIEIVGAEAFARRAGEAGVDGVLVVDCPPEEAAELDATFARHGLHRIALVAPTTTGARLDAMLSSAGGYLYYVSYAGVTGAGLLDTQDVAARVAALRARAALPVAVGFGVRDAASAVAIAQAADGVVIGSALVQAMAGAADAATAAQRAQAFLAPIRAALDAGVESPA